MHYYCSRVAWFGALDTRPMSEFSRDLRRHAMYRFRKSASVQFVAQSAGEGAGYGKADAGVEALDPGPGRALETECLAVSQRSQKSASDNLCDQIADAANLRFVFR